jgi:hypothetical protein
LSAPDRLVGVALVVTLAAQSRFIGDRCAQLDGGVGFSEIRCCSVRRREWCRVGQELWPGTLHSEQRSVACVCLPACSDESTPLSIQVYDLLLTSS